jgi:integrase
MRRAEELQAERGGQPLPPEITPHKLRHTFVSILVAIGKMRRDAERRQLRLLVEGEQWELKQTADRNRGRQIGQPNDYETRVASG